LNSRAISPAVRPRAHRPEADEGLEAGLDHAALDGNAADRVGPVEHHEAQPVARRRLHRESHGGEIGVVTRPYVLDVEDQRVEAAQVRVVRRERGEVLAVERVLGEAGALVHRLLHLLQILHVAAHAVLGPEQGSERHPLRPRRAVQEVDVVAQLLVQAGRIEEGADPQAAQRLAALVEEGADSEPGRASCHGAPPL
jgi:hypothetical protein